MVHRRFARALGIYSGNASVQADTAAKLVAMLPARSWRRVFEVGCADGLLTRMLLGLPGQDRQPVSEGLSIPEEMSVPEGQSVLSDCSSASPDLNSARPCKNPSRFGFEKFFVNDLCEESAAYISDVLESGAVFIPGDAESIPFPENLDLLISSSTIQWMTDLKAFLAKCASSLAPDGVLALGTFGPENLREVRAITGEGLDYYDAGALRELLPEGMGVVACEEEIVTETFGSPFDVLRHLKLTGVNGLSGRTWSKSALEAFVGEYARRFSTGTGEEVTLTYHPVRMVIVKQ
ncbi:MAG: methyltransferase domain-containing protein [Candidatus Cryptobacteroides sp.]